MSKIWIVAVATLALAHAATAGLPSGENISTKKLFIKDNANPAKRQVQLQSKDTGVQFSEADNPGANGAIVHVYSATDNFCAMLLPGTGWKGTSSAWKYKNKTTGTSAQIGNGKLAFKIKSLSVSFTLADNVTQGAVNAQVQFGTNGKRYCMHCTTAKKNDAKKYLAKDCVATACDAEPAGCVVGATTTTTTVASTTTTTLLSNFKGALTATPGRFNYNLTLGLPGANAACNTNFAGTHACTLTELQSGQAAGALAGLKDIGNNTVTGFWAIDPAQPALQQCNDSLGTLNNWEYATAHTMSRGQQVALNNPAGTLGSLQSSIQCNFTGNFTPSWVGCCN